MVGNFRTSESIQGRACGRNGPDERPDREGADIGWWSTGRKPKYSARGLVRVVRWAGVIIAVAMTRRVMMGSRTLRSMTNTWRAIAGDLVGGPGWQEHPRRRRWLGGQRRRWSARRLSFVMLLLLLFCLEMGWMDGWNGRKRTLPAVRLRLPVMLGGQIGTSAGSRVSRRNPPPSMAGEAAVLALALALARLSLVGVGASHHKLRNGVCCVGHR